MKHKNLFVLAPCAVLGLAIWASRQGTGPEATPSSASPQPTGQVLGQPPPLAMTAAPEIEPAVPVRVEEAKVAPGSTLSKVLKDLNFEANDREAVLSALKPLLDPTRVAAGTLVRALFKGEADLANRLELKLSETKTLIAEARADAATPDDTTWNASMHEVPVTSTVAAYSGTVTSNLWSSAQVAGMDTQLVTQLAEVFAWQIDFNRALREGDKWRLTVERLYAAGKPIGYGELLAAEYVNAGTTYTAVRFDHDNGTGQFYAPDGSSLRRMFLKSPLKFGRITSGFSSKRFHPILKVNKAHLGIDYGAPIGTPIMAVGDGTVTFAQTHGGSGKMVKVRHNSIYETHYKHLNGYAKDLGVGTKVVMGQVIGYVGQTGLATGPHLHFEFHEGASVVDPAGMKFPTADPVPEDRLAEFKTKAEVMLGALPAWDEGLISLKAE